MDLWFQLFHLNVQINQWKKEKYTALAREKMIKQQSSRSGLFNAILQKASVVQEHLFLKDEDVTTKSFRPSDNNESTSFI